MKFKKNTSLLLNNIIDLSKYYFYNKNNIYLKINYSFFESINTPLLVFDCNIFNVLSKET